MALLCEKNRILNIMIIIMMITYEISARPENEWRQNNSCQDGDSIKREICQRCAQQTKSPLVYPMCCNEEDAVHKWCYHYTTYGKVA
uniref:Uncharacterized protein LOC114325633 n=1 Tax=Diabrotica virgifera virgifera TaxID=50390 RepID=A0A6P7F1R1_DIAVI